MTTDNEDMCTIMNNKSGKNSLNRMRRGDIGSGDDSCTGKSIGVLAHAGLMSDGPHHFWAHTWDGSIRAGTCLCHGVPA